MKFLLAILLSAVLTASEPVAPVLLTAAPVKSKIYLEVTHPTATEFSVLVVHQDEGIDHPTPSLINQPNWRRNKDGVWTTKIKLLGDTNKVCVAVRGTTNWSNIIVSIP